MKTSEPMPKNTVWITPREAAEYLNVGVDIIYNGRRRRPEAHTAGPSHDSAASRMARRLGGGSHARREVR